MSLATLSTFGRVFDRVAAPLLLALGLVSAVAFAGVAA